MKHAGKVRRFFAVLTVVLTMVFACGMSVFAQNGMTVRITGAVEGENLGLSAEMIESGEILLAVEEDDEGMLFNGGLNIGDTQLFSLLLKADDEKVSFQLPQVDDKVYEIGMERVAELLQSGLEMLQQGMSAGGQSFDISQLTGPAVSGELYAEAFEPYMELIGNYFSENATFSEDETVELSGLEEACENCMVVIIRPEAEKTEAFLTTLAEQLENDEKMAGLISEWADYLRSLQGVLTLTGQNGEMDAEETAQLLEEGYAQFPAFLNENAAQIAQALEAVQAQIRIALDESGMPVLIELTFDAEEDMQARAALELLAIGDDGNEYSYYAGYSQGEDEACLLGYSYTGEDEVYGQARIDVTDMGTMAVLNYEFDLNHTTALGAPCGSAQLDVMGVSAILSFEEGIDDYTDRYSLNMSGLSAFTASGSEGAETVDGFTVNVDTIMNTEVYAPEGETVDITSYSDEELAEFFSQTGEKMMNYLAG